MSDAAPHNEGALSVPVAATIAVGAAGLPAVVAGDLALSDPFAAAFLWAVATTIAVGVIAGLAVRDRWRSGVVSASAFAGFMLGNLALVKPAVLGVVSWCAGHAARRPPNADTMPDEIVVLSTAALAAVPAALFGAAALSALAGWAVSRPLRGHRPPRPFVDAWSLAVTGGALSVTIISINLLPVAPLAWTILTGNHVGAWAGALGVGVFGGGVIFTVAMLWFTAATVRATIQAGLLRRFTSRGGVLSVILAVSLTRLAHKHLNMTLQALELEQPPQWASRLVFLGVFAVFVWLTRPRVGVRPVTFATVFDAALLLTPTLTALVTIAVYGGGALVFGPVALIIPLQEGRPPSADELAHTRDAIKLFAAGPPATLHPMFAVSCVPLLLYGLLRRRPAL